MNCSTHRRAVTSDGGAVRAIALASATALLSAVPRTAAAQLATCRVVDSIDVISLFGRSAEPQVNPVTGVCTWGNVAIDRRGLTLSISMRDTTITIEGYARGRELAANNGTITDEPRLGDRAYSVVVSYGTTITILTQGQIVQLRYANGVPGSPADVSRLRSVAANVIGRLRSAPVTAAPITTSPPP
jgi:hypothetical protein